MKKIIVTGGAGFIGSHLCKKLLEDLDNYVICLDDMSTGNLNNIADLFDNSRFEFMDGDVRIISVENFHDKIDEIYHLACPASPIQYQKNPIKTLETNFLGTKNMLYLAKKNKAKILLTSTSEIYGDPHMHPQEESYWGNVNPIGIRSCYDEGKRIAETLMFDFHRYYGVNIRVARIFNTYGPHLSKDDGRVVSNFIIQALKGKDITIYGKGDQTRSFCYVSDTVDGLMKLMNHSTETGPVNIGNPDEYNMKELAEIILKKVGNTKSKLVYLPLPKDDPTRRRPNITKAKDVLRWEPTISLSDGLEKTIKYFDEKP